MHKRNKIIHTINARILSVLLMLFITIVGVIGVINNRNIRGLYEKLYTQQLLLTNALMGSLIQSKDVEYFVDLIKNQDDAFKQRQVDFYHDRNELFSLQEMGAPEEEQQALLDRLATFHAETRALKNDAYWDTLKSLKELKVLSGSTYVYVMADTGLETNDGETLYTYIFDAEDEGDYSSPDMDGLGTSDIGNEAFTNVFTTKKQTEKAELYEGDFGELYFVCVPILNDAGDVVAILGTDLSVEDMNSSIEASTLLFNSIIIAVFIISVIIVFILLSYSIGRPISSLTKTALTFAEGNLHTSIPKSALKRRTEIGTLAHAIKNTLDATTLYLNSIPEGLFIMNRDCETYFRNEQFIKRFGSMNAHEFISELFPLEAKTEIEKRLRQENSTTIAWIDNSCFAVMLREIALANMTENSILVIANDITALMKEKENAQAAAAAKSAFLSRMSHEMRTPMNAILGMAKVAEGSDSISNIKYCLSTINTSSEQLLSIINDVLDMSKIEAGKLELEYAPINVEKTLMKVCNIVIDTMESKKQTFHVVLSKDLNLHYMADDLRLSQILTNLLSNAAKFTPEGGTITLTVENIGQQENMATLRFSVADTGIGMTNEQISRLFNSFEQADGSISRKFGGTGLGLAISKNIIEKMGGHIDVVSEPNVGSTFSFSMALECISCGDIVVPNGVAPENIRLLVIENDDDIREYFVSIVKKLGISIQATGNAEEAIALLDTACKTNHAYDIVFFSYETCDSNGVRLIDRLSKEIDKDSIVIITTYPGWHNTEKYAHENNITNYITKPIFPSSVLNVINSVMGKNLKASETKPEEADSVPDISGVRVLLAEDIDINREVFLALMEGTGILTEIAENGLEAVLKFKDNPELYDIIIMDIQMPEMDGYEATKTIRAMETPRSKTIPIVAMSANAFKEDIDRCLASGMNDHLSKPINAESVIEKIIKYVSPQD